ncbi:DUF3606 domain-containing protein [Bosea sp. NBC_00550]|uniref:DUF3606 domain-containing protein n=1 Tax=Bosea sp. NBC_00550 TaxID=2969621 RepID=UPI003FA4C120
MSRSSLISFQRVRIVQQPATFRSAGVEPHELKYCTQKFGVSAEQLKAAVEKAGVVQQRWPSY